MAGDWQDQALPGHFAGSMNPWTVSSSDAQDQ
eukprot:CAMPEP_0174299344 /NCGR_PEP_ID=MMETSP0809-20121228/56417_1 /TAXON_ID=73025 ORGANISM="Eutreptiella gymnastica-like, Strain CCMP1594" /NCGR_SAMPLE_ID=MMETSP0809 /ASSEMBLY_ACC=CAM_ASM_000658 /LENGTH=31 /DNA_ID= /DNA_START= /DNA_END= /DNA_ORIENTATION=